MTIQQAIDKYKALRKGQTYSDEQLIEWLSELDGRVFNDIISTHEGGIETFTPYDVFSTTFNRNTQLLIQEPYSQAYILYLISQADFFNSETTRYANSSIMFNNKYQDYENWYNSKHLPIKRINIKFEDDADETTSPL